MNRFLVIIFLTVSSIFSQGYWEHVGDMQFPVAAASAITVENKLYIFGGYSDSVQSDVNWVQTLEEENKSWKFDSMSYPRKGLVSQKYNNSVYLYGGIFNESLSFDGIEKWDRTVYGESIFNFDINFNRIFSTGHIIGDNFYIIGGNPLSGSINNTLPYIIEYNLITDSITFTSDSLFLIGDLPEQQMSAVYGNDIYIFGGVVNGISQNIYKFNIINHSFEELDLKLLEPRAGGRAIVDDYFNNIYIIGGYNEASTALNSVEIFYPDSYIEQGSPIQEARYYFMSENWNGTPYILGGFNENGEVVKSIERLGAWATDIDDSEADNTISYAFELFQNYPNPFNPETTINYSVPSSEIASMARQSYDITSVNSLPHNYNVILKIYDVMGCEVKTLVNEPMQPGNYSISFDASHLSSGVYYYQLKISDFIQTKKMVLMK